MTFYRFNWRQSIRPSRSAQVSAMKLLARPMFLENPTNQFPWSFLIRPPQPVVFVDPEAAPSVFSFTQPLFGLSHLICFITFDWLLEGWLTHKVNSMACEKITLASWGFTLLPLKTSWLRWCQISQIARRKVVPREGGGGWWVVVWFEGVLLDLALEVSQSVKFEEKKVRSLLSMPSWYQIGFTSLQSRIAWVIV